MLLSRNIVERASPVTRITSRMRMNLSAIQVAGDRETEKARTNPREVGYASGLKKGFC